MCRIPQLAPYKYIELTRGGLPAYNALVNNDPKIKTLQTCRNAITRWLTSWAKLDVVKMYFGNTLWSVGRIPSQMFMGCFFFRRIWLLEETSHKWGGIHLSPFIYIQEQEGLGEIVFFCPELDSLQSAVEKKPRAHRASGQQIGSPYDDKQ